MMRRIWVIPALVLGLVLLWSVAATAQQVSGRVIDRNGTPQRGCVVEFVPGLNQPPAYRVTSNNEGNFYLANPRYGSYTVWVRRGQQQHQINNVTINSQGLQPSSLVVSW